MAKRVGPGSNGRDDAECAGPSSPAPIPPPGSPARHCATLSSRRHGGGAGSRKAGPYIDAASRLPTRGDILAPVRSLTEPGAPVRLPASTVAESPLHSRAAGSVSPPVLQPRTWRNAGDSAVDLIRGGRRGSVFPVAACTGQTCDLRIPANRWVVTAEPLVTGRYPTAWPAYLRDSAIPCGFPRHRNRIPPEQKSVLSPAPLRGSDGGEYMAGAEGGDKSVSGSCEYGEPQVDAIRHAEHQVTARGRGPSDVAFLLRSEDQFIYTFQDPLKTRKEIHNR